MKVQRRTRKGKNKVLSPVPRWIAAVCIPIFIFTYLVVTGNSAPLEAKTNRVIMLGFDGMDYELTKQYLSQGILPNLQALSEQGVFSALDSTNPSESPVAWSSMITGTNPGKTGVFDFLRRNPVTYFPELNMTDIVTPPEFLFDKMPIAPPVLENGRKGSSFWEYASQSSITMYGISVPMNMPPDTADGTYCLCGLGVPDARRTMGTYVYYVDDVEVARDRTGSEGSTEMGGRVIEVVQDQANPNLYTSILPGPYYPSTLPQKGSEMSADISMLVNPDNDTCDFTITNRSPFKFLVFFGGGLLTLVVGACIWAIGGTIMKSAVRGFGISLLFFIVGLGILGLISKPNIGEHKITLKKGEWSEWVPAKYLVTDWVGLNGFFKIYYIEGDPNFQLYVTPVSIDPRGTLGANLSYPSNYAQQLLSKYGYFKTYGWDSETWAFNENVIDEQAYLDDLLGNFHNKSEMALSEMKAHEDWEMFASIFFVTDHVQHMFYRLIDPLHPMYDPGLADQYGDSIKDVFIEADNFVGRVMNEVMEPGDVLIVISDHGFNSFRNSVNINRWLVDNGYLYEKPNLLSGLLSDDGDQSVSNLFDNQKKFFQWVDWSKSKAYALGLGQIYLNLEGRESQGIVTANEKDELIDEIIAGLKEMVDPATGTPMLINAYRADEIYHGDHMEYAPDIVVGFQDGYRVSWQTTLGVAAEDLVELNMKKWSGDHCSFDPSITQGVLFSNIGITKEEPSLLDIAPSMLSLLGAPKPDRMDGEIIFEE
ncbi:MAG TPA: alkaline phosphatase family protein [bacterium]